MTIDKAVESLSRLVTYEADSGPRGDEYREAIRTLNAAIIDKQDGSRQGEWNRRTLKYMLDGNEHICVSPVCSVCSYRANFVYLFCPACGTKMTNGRREEK